MSSTADCKAISLDCPVEATIYGYYPNLGGNIIMVAIFAICTLAQIFLGIKYRLRAFPIVVSLGCLGETVGYVGRVLMHSNPWDSGPFIIQILLLIVSPSLLAAGLYLTLKHLVIHYGPQYSRLTPKLYTWIFVTCDAIGFLTQCIGGGIQASADNTDKKMLDMGNNIMVAGVTFQAVVMVVCAGLAIDFAFSLYRHRGERKEIVREPSKRGPRAFQFYMSSFIIAFLAILTRCIYRIPEMAGGWKNHLMRDEIGFMILDGAMIAIACILMTVAFPGIYFPGMAGQSKAKKEKKNTNGDEPSSDELSVLKPAGYSNI
ncbi:related to phospholipid-translocating ATPase [Rhynchosporium secalis]|uniref:Related to phospholipid-translocating ATPase n=1 Tax=Rhynchosporium secalis TaxID=38038 RepID=A0A1E1MP98_RHYSE|nr:related to phospholipid-translocating ATPase [Rhynchosporium secalis]